MTRLSHLSLLAAIQLLLVLSDFVAEGSHGQSSEEAGDQSQVSCSVNTPGQNALCVVNCNHNFALTFQILSSNFGSLQAIEPITISYDDKNKICNKCCRRNSCSSSACNYPECEQSLNLILPITTSPVQIRFIGSTCPLSVANSTDNGTSTSLMFYGEPKSWIDALKVCHSLMSSLVEITNQTVQDKVMSLLQNKTSLENGVWVGLKRSIFGTDPEWMWTSGSRSVNPQWSSSFPVDRWNNHCGKIIWGQGSGPIQLLDASCHEELPYICQMS